MAAHGSVNVISPHILVTMTIEKCYVLVNPYKPKPTRKQALKIAIASVIIISLVMSVHMSILFGLISQPSDDNVSNSSFYGPADNESLHKIGERTNVCTVLPQYENYSEKVFHPIILITTRILYPIMVLMCNLLIIIYLKKHAAQVAPLNATSTANNDKRITRLLIIVSLCFAVLILPGGIYMLLIPSLYEDFSEAIDPYNPVFQAVMNCLLLNHSVNYVLYIMASKTFRKEAQVVFNSLFKLFRPQYM